MIMFKSLLIFSIFIISVPSMATDYTFKEKSPADRVYSENYQGIDSVKQQQRFVFDPKKKIPEAERHYEDLLAEKQQQGNTWGNWNNDLCHRSVVTNGCTGEPAWLHDPEQLKQMIEQARK